MPLSTVVLVQRFVRRLKVRSAFDRLILRVCADQGPSLQSGGVTLRGDPQLVARPLRGVSADLAHVIGGMILRWPPPLDLDAPLRGREEQRFSEASGRKKLNHWYYPVETRMSLS
jgi:hypothetical protein